MLKVEPELNSNPDSPEGVIPSPAHFPPHQILPASQGPHPLPTAFQSLFSSSELQIEEELLISEQENGILS